MSTSFDVVAQFEHKVAEFAGAKHGIAVASGTWAIFLACKYYQVKEVSIPAHTFISVPMAIIHAGGRVKLDDVYWNGVYSLRPYPIWDGALRWRHGMYIYGLHCLSFHARKSLPIGEGGMLLTDDDFTAQCLREMRYSGRSAPFYRVEDVNRIGWQAYMTPEKAARGLHLMDYRLEDEADQVVDYPDLREAPVFSDSL